MDFIEATRAYESWLAKNVPVLEADLRLKHQRMAESPLAFLRATYYRWAAQAPKRLEDWMEAPIVLAVGDLHVENFGTWRDDEGRLVWGVNDFDEAAYMPFGLDLVRLATSALLAAAEDGLRIGGAEACEAILAGYAEALERGGSPFVLEENEPALRRMALGAERDPEHFWSKMKKLPLCKKVPKKVRALLSDHIPAMQFRVCHRIAGLGSLGRVRFVALGEWQGGLVARETKPLLASAYGWALGRPDEKIRYRAIVKRAMRCRDPTVLVSGSWLIRRLAPHCSRIDLGSLPKSRDETLLLHAMGSETANIHLGSDEAIRAIRAELRRIDGQSLYRAALLMAEATRQDWELWREHLRKRARA